MKGIGSALAVVVMMAAGATLASAQDPSDAIFNDNLVATYQLTMSPADWDVIVNDPTGQGRLWKRCTMTWQGAETLTQVAVRAGGHPPPGANPKPHLRLKFDEFVPNQKWRGMDAVKLESMTKNLDRSMLRERLAFWVHRSMGPAARVVHARLYVNGDFKGLYSVIEPVRKAYVRYWWRIPNPDGNLYEIDIYDPNGNVYNGGPPFDHYLWRGSTPATYVPYIWKPVTNEVGGNYQDVVNLLNVLNNASSATRRSQLEGLINLDSFLSYLAGVVATSNFDALPEWMAMPNNHFWYHREDTHRMEIVPWDLDVTFSDITFNGTYMPHMGLFYQFHTTKATAWIQGDAVARDAYLAKLRRIVDGPFATIQSRLDFIYNQIKSHAYADPYKPFTNAQFDAEVSSVRNSFIPKRIAYLNSQLPVAPPPPPPAAANNAQFVSQNVPSTMTAGQTYAVSVTMKNTGTSTWTEAGGYRLGSQNPENNTTWDADGRIPLNAGESIAPNASKTFAWTVTAPATAGTYNFQWRMRQSGVEWFGDTTPNVAVTVSAPAPPPPAATNGAQFVAQTVPSTMTAGQSYSVSVTMRNSGTTTWTEASYRLGSQNPQDNLTWGMNRVSLPAGASVAPGQDAVYSWTVTAPTTPGTYNFQWQMRQSGVEWFGPLTPNVAVAVTAAAPPPPTPTGNAAQFVSQSVPAAMTAGQAYMVSVTLRNTGTTTWTDAAPYRLGSQNPENNTTWGMNRVPLDPGESVTPGQTKTFTWTVTAPTAAATYDFQWQMRQSGVEWFGDLTPNVVVLVTDPAAPPPGGDPGAVPVPTSRRNGENDNGDGGLLVNDKCGGSVAAGGPGVPAWTLLAAALLAGWGTVFGRSPRCARPCRS
jgi:hypothetical protein